jgi:TPR repeat protein
VRTGFLRLGLLFSAFASLALTAQTPAPEWVEVKLPGEFFTVVTDAPAKEGSRILIQLAQFDKSLQRRFPWLRLPSATDAPLLVFASADPALVRSLAPEPGEGEKGDPRSSYWASDWAKNVSHVAAVQTASKEPTDAEPSPYRTYYMGRAAFLLARSLNADTPAWLVRGLAVFLSDTWVKDKEMLTGRIMARFKEAGATPLPTAPEFFRDRRNWDGKSDLFAGLFVHYLLQADGGRHAAALDRLLQALSARESPPNAEGALSAITSLYPGFSKYVSARKFSPLKLPLSPSVTPTAFGVRSMALSEALLQRADVYQAMNRPVDTRTVLRQVKATDPSLARPYEMEAFLFDREQRTAESKQAIEAAIERGSENPHLRYRLAQLQWAPKMTKTALEAVRKLVEFAFAASPQDFKAASYLAEVESDLGLIEPALDHAQKGALAAPQEVYALMALARAQWNARKMDEGLATARKALALARLASQKQRVQEFVTFATRNKAAQAKGGKPWASQFGPPPAGAFGATRAATTGGAVIVGQARTESADAAAIADCFARRDDAACARAVPSLEGACSEKQTTSCVSLGSLYEGGFGVARDRRRAAALYKTACGLGDQAGCARFAVLEAQGLGVPQNSARATKTLESLCDLSVPEGCIGLAQILRQTGFMVDRERARKILQAACDKGSAEACAMVTAR